ncbi:MAG: prepilin-type N-terminal cleavage/methylation domain-containing protein [bacterium]
MKKQSGFTLIELMVVMAIIAILAVAGIAAYMGYIKQARDTARISDLSTINKAILAVVTNTGKSPTTIPDVVTAIKAVNNGTLLKDPQGTATVCQPKTGDTLVGCGYVYRQCDGGTGFAVSARFESKSNQAKYAADGIDSVVDFD